MRGARQVATARLPNIIPGSRWSEWISTLTGRRRRRRTEQLVAIERLGRQRRRALQSGDWSRELRRQWIRRI